MTAHDTFRRFFEVGPEPAWSSSLLDLLFEGVGPDEVVRALHDVLIERAVPLSRIVRNLIDDVSRGCFVRRPLPAFDWLRTGPKLEESVAYLASQLTS